MPSLASHGHLHEVEVSANPLAQGRAPLWATAWGEDRYGAYSVLCVGNVEHGMRWIPPGRFVMGSPKREKGRLDDEGPQHEVVLTRGYWLGETPVTQALWDAVMGENPSRFKGATRPVEQVSWEDCERFISTLNLGEGAAAFRLPTEAEWEYACRAGTTTATWVGNLKIVGQNHVPLLDAIAWYSGNSGVGEEVMDAYDSSEWREKQYEHTRAATHPVGEKAANPWGLRDMLGNVWEWCSNWLDSSQTAAAVDPTGPTSGVYRVARGGSWDSLARYVRAARRNGSFPSKGHHNLGFRLLREHSSTT